MSPSRPEWGASRGSRPAYDVDAASAEARDAFDAFLGCLAPKRRSPEDPCDAFDALTCPSCEHFPTCASREQGQ